MERLNTSHVDTPIESPALLSTCTGMHGLERGLERAIGPVNTVAFLEIEAFAIENLVQQMEQGLLAPAPVWSNVKTFLPIARRLRGKVDIIAGGYPCQPFSHVGRQRGTEDPRHLWPYYGGSPDSIIGAIRPVLCWFENVSNHLNLGYEQVKRDLESLHYTVAEGIFSAQEAGAPHIRKRLFILAMDNAYSRRHRGPQAQVCPRWLTAVSASEKTVDNTQREGLEGHAWHDGGARGRQGQARPATPAGFPMGQGIEQWDWEEPRTLESSVGTSINGYQFREDLLRMAGNAVVEQTAEIAFRTLLKQLIIETQQQNQQL